MGAVFALYSAWYFWIPKILGVNYNKSWGKIHFWILFMGVNVTFFPQHFLGLQGMPRRISDYPDAFAGWNFISSFGSIISVIATWLFLYILYAQLVVGEFASRCPWLSPEFHMDLLQSLLIRAFNSIEWCLNSPPKPHAFVSLPVQSGIEIILDDEVLQLLEQINSWIQSKNLPDFVTVSQEVSKNDWFSICSDEDLKSSTFLDLQSDSTVNKKLTDVDNHLTDKTYYLDTLFGWLDDKFSFLKQDFGKLFPNSVYAMQDFNALRPQDTDLTVMINTSTEVGAQTAAESRQENLDFEMAVNPSLEAIYDLLHAYINEYHTHHETLTNWIRTAGQRLTLRGLNPDLNQVEAFWDDVLHWREDITTREEFITWLDTLVDNYLRAGRNVYDTMDRFEDIFPDHAWYVENLDWGRPRVTVFRPARNVFNQIEEIRNIFKKIWGSLNNIPPSNWPWE